MTSGPTVAIVGRPNVGKSTLFNRLLGRRQAIVHNQPGVTRDRIVGSVELAPGRTVEFIDTGGLVPGDDPLGLNQQVMAAVKESDLLLLVVDGKLGPTAADEHVWAELRRTGRPAILVVNKSDTRAAQDALPEFYRFGLEQVAVSAEHALGVAELREAILERLPEAAGVEAPEVPAIAIVGRPNVGKSTLVNRLMGEDRVLVSDEPGTTRDPVDTLIQRNERTYRLIDTAGIRRRSRTRDAPEEVAVMMAGRQIERASLALLVIDAGEGVTSGDLAIADKAWERGRPLVVAANKWDRIDEESRRFLERSWGRLAQLAGDPPRVNLSALTGRGVERLFPVIDVSLAAWRTQVPTGELNRVLAEIVGQHAAPAGSRGPWKLYYSTQVAEAPPTFMLFANRAIPRNAPYRRFLEKRLRTYLGAAGVPVRLVIRRRNEAAQIRSG